jgi:DNA-binding MarR family transcriptional regulator
MDKKQLLASIIEDMDLMRRKMLQSRAYCKTGDLTHTQAHILLFLANENEMNLKDVAAHMCTSSSAATQLINSLVADTYIVRKEDPQDRRKILLSLTTLGKKRITEIKKAHTEHVTKMLAPLSEAELTQWQIIQRKIIQGLEIK